MTFTTDGVVLKIIKTGESDRLVTLLTRDKGIVKAFAKAADRPKNKLHMSTNLFCYGRFSFYEGASAAKVEECELEETFFALQQDIGRLALAQYFNQLVLEINPVENEGEAYLRLLLNSLYFLSRGERDMRLLKSVFEMRLISMAGYMPSLVSCALCGEFETPVMYFNEETGELFCSHCHARGATAYPLGVIDAMRHIVFSDFNKLFTLRVSGEHMPYLNAATEKHLLLKLQRKFKTLDFYKSVASYE